MCLRRQNIDHSIHWTLFSCHATCFISYKYFHIVVANCAFQLIFYAYNVITPSSCNDEKTHFNPKMHMMGQICTRCEKSVVESQFWVHLIFNSKLSRPGYYKQPTCHFFLIQHKKFITSNAEKFCMQFSHYNS